ncbi:hypothetical protein C8F04DRAFT_1274603 [Mycena alexandri]|uniref:Uncharacterized protein n=1 Tax=Mycena alexandri TaxID=1745969 RepID=A0AAD6WPV1_9AGAR|nr:hypothetical protein C8F04DRAFT_1274603 [Mycena alexandri]
MAQDNNPAPAAVAPTPAAAAGAASSAGIVNQLQTALSSLTLQVNNLTVTSATLLSPLSMADLGVTFSDAANAAGAVQQAHANVLSAFAMAAPLLQALATQSQATAPATASSAAAHTGPWVAGTTYTVVPTAPLTPIPDHGEKWFAITRGRYVGLTNNAAVSLAAVSGVSTALTGKHATQTIALQHFNAALASGAVAVI